MLGSQLQIPTGASTPHSLAFTPLLQLPAASSCPQKVPTAVPLCLTQMLIHYIPVPMPLFHKCSHVSCLSSTTVPVGTLAILPPLPHPSSSRQAFSDPELPVSLLSFLCPHFHAPSLCLPPPVCQHEPPLPQLGLYSKTGPTPAKWEY